MTMLPYARRMLSHAIISITYMVPNWLIRWSRVHDKEWGINNHAWQTKRASDHKPDTTRFRSQLSDQNGISTHTAFFTRYVFFFTHRWIYKFEYNNSTEQWLINQKPFFFVRLPFLLQKLFCISFLAPASVAGSSKPAENKEQMVYLRCVDSQGKVYLIPQKMVTKVIFWQQRIESFLHLV